jgi:ketosteroid isomerase-like protein
MNREVIDRIRQNTEAAENRGSAEDMRLHFADDVVMMGPNMPAVAGAESVAQAMQGFFGAFEVSIRYNSEEVVFSGEWAFDRGEYRHVLTPRQGGQPVEEAGKYLWVYRRSPDGSWKQARVMWNSNHPAAAPA